ncbi:MAG: helix-turn-helix domain-containing protein [Jatrophihabitans sp.]|uniref:ATP-binding protein n=1 Tax=Jatrophihabitans sp. TaxID=1932789 RepID=UPI0039121DE3
MPDDDLESGQAFGAAVRGFRVAARLTQADLADLAGISERAVSDIERGLRTRVYPVTARSLADALHLVGDQRTWFERSARGRRLRSRLEEAQDAEWAAMRRDSLIGRTAEVDQALSTLQSSEWRLATLTGPGGVGKSRVAAEVCASSPEARVLWIQLADFDDADAVRPAIARSAGRPADASPGVIRAALDSEPTLLVLDTFERVLAAADEVARLADATGELRLLVTSRSPLRVRGEREIPIGPLPHGPAADLFRRRAVAAGANLADSAEAAVAEVVAAVSGLPLAIELAAAQLRHLPLPALASELAQPLEVLSGGARELPARQRTMRATIKWSFDLLSPEDRALFVRLSRFAGPWTLDDAQTVAAGTRSRGDILAGVARLCQHALVQPDERGAAGGAGRWRLLDPVREFAWEACVAARADGVTARRHAERTAEIVEAAAPRLLGHQQAEARIVLRDAAPNVRVAVKWALDEREADLALRLVAAMWMSWRVEGAFTEGRAWVEGALGLPEGAGSVHRPQALWAAAWLAYHQRDFSRATVCGEQLRRAAAASADRLLARNALTILGEVAMAERRFGDAVDHLSRALALATEAEAPWHRATSLLNLGTALVHGGDPVRAETLLLEALAEHERAGDMHFAARSTIEAGYASLVAGDLAAARNRFVDGLRRFMAVAELWGTAEAVMGVAVVAAALGDVETAATLAGATDAAYAEMAVHLIEPDAALARRVLDACRVSADEATWSTAWAEGRTLSVEDAARIALDRMVGQS